MSDVDLLLSSNVIATLESSPSGADIYVEAPEVIELVLGGNTPIELVPEVTVIELLFDKPVGASSPDGPSKFDGKVTGTNITGDVGPAFTYSSGLVTRIDYDDGSYKELTYADGLLSRLDYVRQGYDLRIRKDFVYSGGILQAINQTQVA